MSTERPVRGIEKTSIPGVIKLLAGEYVPDAVKGRYSHLKRRVLFPAKDVPEWAADDGAHGLRNPIVLFHLGSALVRDKLQKVSSGKKAA